MDSDLIDLYLLIDGEYVKQDGYISVTLESFDIERSSDMGQYHRQFLRLLRIALKDANHKITKIEDIYNDKKKHLIDSTNYHTDITVEKFKKMEKMYDDWRYELDIET